jgi:hypothetical protein
MAIDNTTVLRRPSRRQRLIDRSLPMAALAAVGSFSIILSVLLLRVAGDALMPPFSSAYTAGQNPWIVVMNRAPPAADAVAFKPTERAAH